MKKRVALKYHPDKWNRSPPLARLANTVLLYNNEVIQVSKDPILRWAMDSFGILANEVAVARVAQAEHWFYTTNDAREQARDLFHTLLRECEISGTGFQQRLVDMIERVEVSNPGTEGDVRIGHPHPVQQVWAEDDFAAQERARARERQRSQQSALFREMQHGQRAPNLIGFGSQPRGSAEERFQDAFGAWPRVGEERGERRTPPQSPEAGWPRA